MELKHILISAAVLAAVIVPAYSMGMLSQIASYALPNQAAFQNSNAENSITSVQTEDNAEAYRTISDISQENHANVYAKYQTNLENPIIVSVVENKTYSLCDDSTITIAGDSCYAGLKLAVTLVQESDEKAWQYVTEKLPALQKKPYAAAFDFYEDGVKTSPDSDIEVTLSVPEDVTGAVLYCVTQSGDVTVLASGLSSGAVVTAPVNSGMYLIIAVPSPGVVVLPFTDVVVDSYYYDAVDWAVVNGITNGTTETTFDPEDGCTRAETVTFLWRNMGSPEPNRANCPFTDIDKQAYYGKAVLWATENKITKGTSETTFEPDKICSRAECMTFLWRMEESPEPETTSCPFTDVDTQAYYAKSVLWASENSITNGTSETTFSPHDICNRAQVVTFLWRMSE